MEPAERMYPSYLEKFQSAETFATAYSVAVGNPEATARRRRAPDPRAGGAPPVRPRPVQGRGRGDGLRWNGGRRRFVVG